MILICENCETRFLLSASQLGPEGRRVRCSHCGHEWYQDPPEDESFAEIMANIEPIPDSVRPAPEGSALPAISDEEGAKETDKNTILISFLLTGVIFILLLAGLILVRGPLVKFWPPSYAAYDLLGMAPELPGEKLIIDRITAQIVPNETGLNILRVGFYVMNMERGPARSVPPLRISLRRANGEVIDSWMVAPRGQNLGFEEEAGFTSTYPAPPTDAHNVIVRFEPFGKVPVEAASAP